MGDGSQRKLRGGGSVITTIAGAASGSDDDGVLAKNAPVSSHLLAFGADGTLFMAWGSNLSRIDPTGHLYQVADLGSTNDPDCMAVARDGSVYLSYIRDQRLAVVRGGVVSDMTVTDPLTSANLTPEGLAIDNQNNLWVTTGVRAYKVDPSGQILDWIGNGVQGMAGDGGPAHDAQLESPANITVAPDGDIFLSDYGAINVRYVTPDGIIHTVLSGPDGGFGSGGPVRGVNGFVADREHNIYVSHGTVGMIRPDGSQVTIAGRGSSYTGDGGPALAAGLFATDIRIGPDGALYESDDAPDPNNPFYDSRIRRIGSPMPRLGRDELALPSADGSELYVFSSDGRHLRTQDALTTDVRLSFGYDPNGLLTSITDIHNNVVTIERDATTGLPLAVVAPGGQRTTLAVGNDGYLSAITNPAGESYTFGYSNDLQGLMTSLTDPKHQTHTFSYDLSGLLLTDNDPAGGSTTLNRSGDDSSFTVTKTTGEGRVSTFQVTAADDGSYSEAITDAAGNTSQQSASADGSIQSTAPDGTTTAVLRSPDPRFGIQAPVGSATVTTPDGRQLSVATQRVVTMTNDPTPALATATETTTVAGNQFTSSFDVPSRTWTMTSSMGRSTTAVLDGQGQLLSSTVAGLTPLQYTHDGQGRLTAIAQGARTVGFSYDSANHLLAVTDPLQRTVRYTYDAADRVVQQTLNDGRVVGFTYDASGNLAALTPPGRTAQDFTFTPVDHVVTYAPPPVTPGGATLYSYNKDRQITRVDHPDGRSVVFAYDSVGRRTSIAMSRGSVTYDWEDVTGRLASLTAPDGGEISYDYDGSLLTDATWEGPVSGSISWNYDSRFNVNAETVNCATSTSLACQTAYFGYDGDGLLVSAGPLNIDNDPSNGRITGTQLGSVIDLWSYNNFGEPTAYTASVNGGYTYDDSGRLIDVTVDGVAPTHYTYDENGNRLTRATQSGTESATFDAQDRLLAFADAIFTYTANGERATKTDGTGTTSYDYDEMGNLVSASLANGHRVDYVIDAENRRIGKKFDGVFVQRFIFGNALAPVAEVDGNGNVVARFIYGTHVNVPDVMIKGDTSYRVVSDTLGSPRLVINSDTGETVQILEYDEFGVIRNDSNPGFQPFGFAGGMYDSDTGLVHFGARDYDPVQGRWLSADPVLFSGGSSNYYTYAENDPINLYDPDGESGILTIHSSGMDGGSLATVADGHAWITYKPDGGTEASYGLYGNHPEGRENGLQDDYELRHSDAYGMGQASRTTWISDFEERRLMALIGFYRGMGEKAFILDEFHMGPNRNCSTFASDAWYAATGERLAQRDGEFASGPDNPTSLRNSIVKANNGLAHRVLLMGPPKVGPLPKDGDE